MKENTQAKCFQAQNHPKSMCTSPQFQHMPGNLHPCSSGMTADDNVTCEIPLIKNKSVISSTITTTKVTLHLQLKSSTKSDYKKRIVRTDERVEKERKKNPAGSINCSRFVQSVNHYATKHISDFVAICSVNYTYLHQLQARGVASMHAFLC